MAKSFVVGTNVLQPFVVVVVIVSKLGADGCKDSVYHIWYAIQCEVEPNLPVKTITATCPVLSSKELVIDILKNKVQEEELKVS